MSREAALKHSKSQLHALCGGKIASKATVLREMVGLEKTLKTQSARDWARQRDVTKRLNKMYAPVRGDDEHVVGLLQELRSRYADFRERKPSSPKALQEKERIYLGSLGRPRHSSLRFLLAK